MSGFIDKVYEIISPVLLKHDIKSVREDPHGDRISFFNDKVAVTLIKDFLDQTIFLVFSDVKKINPYEGAQLSEKQIKEIKSIGLGDVLHVRNKDIIESLHPEQRSYPLPPYEDQRVLQIISECLENYCDDILSGDFSIHSLTDKLVEYRIKSFIEGSPEQEREEWRKIYNIKDD